MLARKELIKKYLDFFKGKSHREIKNSPLIPENDPTVLFTTAGMHPLVPYLLGQPHPLGKRLCNVQKCIRTDDIEEVGDDIHLTFFEMLGNWSLGDYWKKEAIEYSFEFHEKVLKVPLKNYAVTIFAGNKNVVKDTESKKVWLSLEIPKEKIFELKDNWWGPAGKIGPCGPDTEMFYWIGKEKVPRKFNPDDKRWVEIGNNVIMEYVKNEKGNFNIAKQKNIDFGGGVERTLAVLQNKDIFETEIFFPIIQKIEDLSRKKYLTNNDTKKAMRIIADHIKASVFILAEGVAPENKERGYVLRRLIRRAVRYAKELKIKSLKQIAEPVFEIYSDYSHLQKNKEKIFQEIEKEEQRFKQTLEKGLNYFTKITSGKKKISGKDSFLLYQSYGFPIELTKELAKDKRIGIEIREFEKEQLEHQHASRTASAGKFKSGLADSSNETTRLHTAAHLLVAALRKVLKNEKINQRGANITPERLRFDFSFSRKISEEEIKEIEKFVNKKIQESIDVEKQEMTLEQAKKFGATGIFDEKYGSKVFVYTINNFSKEICAGPHVKNTSELGVFKIIKEESSGAGTRRIRAVLTSSAH